MRCNDGSGILIKDEDEVLGTKNDYLVTDETKRVSKLNIDEIFDINKKSVVEFDTITPKGNKIKGLIKKSRKQYLGSLLVTEVNGEETHQFVQSMPKIHYYEDIDETINEFGQCYEKLDGSCIIIYPLKNSSGDIIELVPKSRGLPVADKNLRSMVDLVETSHIKRIYDIGYDVNLMFELYGIKNMHDIQYMDTYIDMKLIAVYHNCQEFWYKSNQLEVFSTVVNLELPKSLFHSNTDNLILTDSLFKYRAYLPDDIKRCYPDVSLDEQLTLIKDILQTLNTNYYRAHGRILIEGVVANAINSECENTLIKIKPHDIEEKAKGKNGVPKKFIRKEVFKFYDEHGLNECKQIYKDNQQVIIDFVCDGLSEEFPVAMVINPKTSKRILEVFIDIINSKEVPESVNNLANKLIDENPDLTVKELMRVFGQEYPLRKKDSRVMFSTLQMIKKEK